MNLHRSYMTYNVTYGLTTPLISYLYLHNSKANLKYFGTMTCCSDAANAIYFWVPELELLTSWKMLLLDNFELPVVIFWRWISWCKSWTDMHQTTKRPDYVVYWSFAKSRSWDIDWLTKTIGTPAETPLLFDPLALMYICIRICV